MNRTLTRIVALVVGLLLAGPVSTSSAALMVDMGPTDNNAQQSGFVLWNAGTDGTNIAANNDLTGVSRTFTNAETGFGGFTATVTTNVDIRVRTTSTATGTYANLGRDAFKQSAVSNWDGTGTPSTANATLVLQFTGLTAGLYDMSSFHHDAGNVLRNFALYVTDVQGTNRQLFANQVPTTGYAINSIANPAYQIQSDGTNPVTLYFHVRTGTASNEIWLNGFTLSIIPEPASMALLGLGGLLILPRRKRVS